jgi:phage tail-like protein
MGVYKVYEWNTGLTFAESDSLSNPNTNPLTTFYAGDVKIEPFMLPNTVKLSWVLPTQQNFDRIVVYRRTDQFQIDPLSPYGTQIYSGRATEIYDYWVDNSQVPVTQPSYPNVADDSLEHMAKTFKDRDGKQVLNANQIYYYTVFAADTANNFYYSPTTMVTAIPIGLTGWAERLWESLPTIYQEKDTGSENDPLQADRGYLQRLLWLLGLAFEWMDAKIRVQTRSNNIYETEPSNLDYLAAKLGWELDKSASLMVQRNSILNAVSLYQMAGTLKGLDTLVKYYSGFPTSSGITEGSLRLLESPLFTTSQIYYTDRGCPDFTTFNAALIGTTSDPLFYNYDFSPTNKNGTNSFTAYVQPPYTLTSDQITTTQTRLKRILDKFVPLGVSYTITIYNK